MINLLTGKFQSHADTTDPSLLKEPWTAEAHLLAVQPRRVAVQPDLTSPTTRR